MWRRTDGVDGRWRWLLKDCDSSLGIWGRYDDVDKNYYDYLRDKVQGNSLSGSNLFARLIDCPEFKDYYVNLNIVYQGDFLNQRTFDNITDEIVDACYDEIMLLSIKWGMATKLLDGYYEKMYEWIRMRQENMPKIMREEWNLGEATNISVNAALGEDEMEGMTVRYNDILLSRGVFDGVDYVGRKVTLSGENIRGWIVKKSGDESQIIDGPEYTFTVGDESYEINAINVNTGLSGIVDVNAGTTKDFCLMGDEIVCLGWAEVFDIAGRKIGNGNIVRLPAHGMYIVRTGNKTSKIIY